MSDILLREGRRQATIHGWHDLDADVFAQGWAAARAATGAPLEQPEPTPVAPPLMAWESWWCRTCGNRYTIEVEGCSCGSPVEPVTVQIVARQP